MTVAVPIKQLPLETHLLVVLVPICPVLTVNFVEPAPAAEVLIIPTPEAVALQVFPAVVADAGFFEHWTTYTVVEAGKPFTLTVTFWLLTSLVFGFTVAVGPAAMAGAAMAIVPMATAPTARLRRPAFFT